MRGAKPGELSQASLGRPHASSRGTVFGLDVAADVALPWLDGARAQSTGRNIGISWRQEADGWRFDGEVVSEQLNPDGSLCFRIESVRGGRYGIWGPCHGTHLLSGDGSRLRCTGKAPDAWGWQRMLLGQVLPFAAVLQGLEVLHASAVVVDGQAVAFVGPSGAGKTSVALALCRMGASFLADDVVALECGETTLVAHPGCPLAGVEGEDAGGILESAAAARVVAVEGSECMVGLRGASGPAPLAALFFLDRLGHRAAGRACDLVFEETSDARALMGATFNFVLKSPRRLEGLLHACALMSRCQVERVSVGPMVKAPTLAQAIVRRLSEAR